MISFEEHGMRFNYRAVAIVLHQDRVLVHRVEDEDFWSLPGGRVELCEAAAAAVRREMHEELGVDVTVERLIWLAETFFEHGDERHHELGLYFLVSLAPEAPIAALREPFFGDEGGLRLIFEWAPLSDLEALALPLYPIFLRQGLRALPATVTHIVHYETADGP
jgi:ADP-ribose pyrophosphatase YjhB (NUDIX family)